MNIIDAPLFFQKDKAKELNDTIFDNTGCFIFLKIGEFPFATCCQNYRQAFYSLILDSYVLFHDYGRFFLYAFANTSKISVPTTLPDLLKYRGILAHSQFEPEIRIMDSFTRLITANNVTSVEEFYVKVSNANDNDYRLAYNALKKELDTFYYLLLKVTGKSIKKNFYNYSPQKNRLTVFKLSLNQALIKSILQVESGIEKPSYLMGNVTYCKNGNVEIQSFGAVQQVIISKFSNNQYNTPDEIYPDFRNEVVKTVNSPPQSSAFLLNST